MARWNISGAFLVLQILCIFCLSMAHEDDVSSQIEAKGKMVDALSSSIEKSTNKMEDEISVAGQSIDSKDAVQRVEDEGELVDLYSQIMDQITEQKGRQVENLDGNEDFHSDKAEKGSKKNGHSTLDTSMYDAVDKKSARIEKLMEQKEKAIEDRGKLVEEIGRAIERTKRFADNGDNFNQVTVTQTPKVESNFGIQFKLNNGNVSQNIVGKVKENTNDEIHCGVRLQLRTLQSNVSNFTSLDNSTANATKSNSSGSWIKYMFNRLVPQKAEFVGGARKSLVASSEENSMKSALQSNVKGSWRQAMDNRKDLAVENEVKSEAIPKPNNFSLVGNDTVNVEKDGLLPASEKNQVIVPMEKERLSKLLFYSYLTSKTKKGDFKSLEDAFVNGTKSPLAHISAKALQSLLGDQINKTKVITPTSSNHSNGSLLDIEQILQYIKTLNDSITQSVDSKLSNNSSNTSEYNPIMYVTRPNSKPTTVSSQPERHFNRFLQQDRMTESNNSYPDKKPSSTPTRAPISSPVNEVISDIGKEVSEITSSRRKSDDKSACKTTECVARELIKRLGKKFLKEPTSQKDPKSPEAPLSSPKPSHLHHDDFKEMERYMEDDDKHHMEHIHTAHNYGHGNMLHRDVHDIFIDDPNSNHVHIAPPYGLPTKEQHHNEGQDGRMSHHFYNHKEQQHTPGVSWVHPFHPLPYSGSGEEAGAEEEVGEDDPGERHGEDYMFAHHPSEFIEPEYLRHEASQLPNVIPADQLPPLIPSEEHLGSMLENIEHHMSSNVVMPPVSDLVQNIDRTVNNKMDDLGLKRDDYTSSLIDTIQGVPFNSLSVPQASSVGLLPLKSENQGLPSVFGAGIQPDPANMQYETPFQIDAIKKSSTEKVTQENTTKTTQENNTLDDKIEKDLKSQPKDNLAFLKRANIQPELNRVKHHVHGRHWNMIPSNGQGVSYLSYLTERYGKDLENNLRKGSMDVEAVGREIERSVNQGVKRVTDISYKVEGPDYDRHGRVYPNIHPKDVEDEVRHAMRRWRKARARGLKINRANYFYRHPGLIHSRPMPYERSRFHRRHHFRHHGNNQLRHPPLRDDYEATNGFKRHGAEYHDLIVAADTDSDLGDNYNLSDYYNF